jgi:S-adenosylmethionine:tRNA ribosyltransferase-isomerase
MPSAGRPLTFGVTDALRKRGVAVAAVTHGAGISSTGATDLDARLPLPERFIVGSAAVEAVRGAHAGGGRVVAVGTTVVRALESAFLLCGGLSPCEGNAKLVIGPGFRPQVADAILTGIHQKGTSHFALLEAFAPRALLERALAQADGAGYLEHEFGDSMLVTEHSTSRE